MTSNESSAIDVLRFFCVLFVVPLHCCMSYHVPIPPCDSVLNVEAWFCAFGFKGLAVLLFLGGWLFFRGVPQKTGFVGFWIPKFRRRIKSLGIPFLIWFAVALAYRGALGKLPAEMDASDPLHVLRYMIGWDGFCAHPGGAGIWYLKTLLVAAALAPLYWAAYRALGRIALVAGVFCAISPPFSIDFPFFSAWFFLGGCVAYQRIELSDLTSGFDRALPVSAVLFAAYQLLAASRIPHARFLDFAPYALALSVFETVRKMDEVPGWLSKTVKSSTFVYFAHFYAAGAVGAALRAAIRPETGLQASVAYVLCVFPVAASAVSGYFVLRRFAPRFLAAITGGRS